VNNVDNNLEASTNEDLEVSNRTITIKSYQGFNESNLMTLPIFSLKRKRVTEINRIWIKGEQEVGLTVVGTEKSGCPTIYELDVLMALFKILAKSIDNVIEVTTDNKVTNLPKVINFTYRKLAKEMGMSGFGSKTKERLERSIKCLTEATIYTNLAFRNQEIGEYVADFAGEESSRILKNYKSYSVSKRKKLGQNLLSADQIEELQSVEIDDFFFKNMCSNYFKLYDSDKYMLLTKGVAKKILLILTQWSHGYEKLIKLRTLYDYIGLEVDTTEDEYYNNRLIKESLEELLKVKFIQDYKFDNDKGVLFVFNTTVKIKSQSLNKYTKDEEVVARLREIGIDWADITKHCRLDTMSYVSALLRYVDDRNSKKQIDDIRKFVLKGLPYGSYDVRQYEIEI
jgi:hypothetical protein